MTAVHDTTMCGAADPRGCRVSTASVESGVAHRSEYRGTATAKPVLSLTPSHHAVQAFLTISKTQKALSADQVLVCSGTD